MNHAVTQRLTAIHEWQENKFKKKNRKFVLRELIFYLILLDEIKITLQEICIYFPRN